MFSSLIYSKSPLIIEYIYIYINIYTIHWKFFPGSGSTTYSMKLINVWLLQLQNLKLFFHVFILILRHKCICSPYILDFFFFILVLTFSFHYFQSLNQLTHVISVFSISQQMEITVVTNGNIKILLKIHYSTHQIK